MHDRDEEIDYDDPNDPRNYPMQDPLLPPINMSSRNTDDGPLMYHDFDYIGYEQNNRNQKRTPDHKKQNKGNNYRSIAVGDTNKL